MNLLSTENFISTKEAGEFSGYTSDYLSRLVRSEKIEGKKIGHSWLIEKKSLALFIANQSNQKAEKARKLSKERAAEYRKHITKLGTQSVVPQRAPKQFDFTTVPLRDHVFAFSTAVIVVVSGAIAAQAAMVPNLSAKTVALASVAVTGFSEVAQQVPIYVGAQFASVHSAIANTQKEVAENTYARSETIGTPFVAGFNQTVRMLSLVAAPAGRTYSEAFALRTPVSKTHSTFMTATHVRGSMTDFYSFISTPSLWRMIVQGAYQHVGEVGYQGILSALDGYRSLIVRTGDASFGFAVSARDLLRHAPDGIAEMNLALGHAIIDTTHALITADTRLAYACAAAAPKTAEAAFVLVSNLGAGVGGTAARVPALATRAFLNVTKAPSILAPALAQGVFTTTYDLANTFVHMTDAVTTQYLAFIEDTSKVIYGTTAAGIAFAEEVTTHLAHAPTALATAYRTGYTWVSETIGTTTLPGVRHLASLQNLSLPKLPAFSSSGIAAVATSLSTGEQVALTTYETIHGFFSSLFGGSARTTNLAVTPTAPTSTPPVKASVPAQHVTITNYPTYTTVVKGISQPQLDQSLTSLRANILSTVAGMVAPVAAQTVTNVTSIQQVNMIEKLHDLIVINGDFQGGSLTGATNVSANSGNFTTLNGGTTSLGTTTVAGNLTVSGTFNPTSVAANTSIFAPYFVATSTTATSTFNGGLLVSGYTSLATTTITGGLTVNGNTNITQGGELTVGDKIIAPGEIGLGTSTPSAKLSIQSTSPTQTALLIYGTTTQSSPFIDVFNSSNSNLLRLTAAGYFGLGTLVPSAVLDVEGTLKLNGNYPIGTNNVALGGLALASTSLSGSNNTAVGWSALTNNTSGTSNTAIGERALITNSTGSSNVAIGVDTMRYNTSGISNTATGLAAMEQNTTGSKNTANGYLALRFNTTGTDNIGIGYRSGYSNGVGGSNVSIGNDALFSNNGSSFNTAIGAAALNIAAGGSNTGIGYRAGSKITTGQYNTVIGYGGTTGVTTGSNNIIIGQEVRAGLTATGDNQLNIGNLLFGTGLSSAATLSTGNIGIATSSPYAKLAVGGDVVVGAATAGGTLGSLYLPKLKAAAGAFIAVDASGKVIATSTPQSGVTSVSSSDSTLTISPTTGAVVANLNLGKANTWTALQQFNANASTTQLTSTGSTYLATAGGSVGIGTATPAYKLDVAGSVNIDQYSSYKQAGNTILYASSTNYSTLVGNGAGSLLTATGIKNTAVGYQALTTTTTGDGNTAVGYQTLTASTASYNTAVGYQALTANTTSTGNAAFGYQALLSNTVSGDNSAFGYNALSSNTSYNNSAFGSSALAANTTGNYNAGFGYNVLSANLTGSQNAGFGANALRYVTGSSNTAMGYDALQGSSGNSTGVLNTAIGHRALYSNTSGANNTAVGGSALFSNTSGTYNVGIGVNALNANTTGSNNTAVGYALSGNTTGTYNTSVGMYSLSVNTTGGSNSALGYLALQKNTTGSFNTAIGQGALQLTTTGLNNTALGYQALYNNTSATNTVAIGFRAAANISNAYNNQGGVYLGYQSGYNAATGSDYNTLLGYQSGYNVTTGQYNIQLGYQGTTGGLTTGSNNIVIGKDLRPTGFDGTASNQLNIGNLLFATGLGSGTTLGTGNVGVGTTSPSSRFSVEGDSYFAGKVGVGTKVTDASSLVVNGQVVVGDTTNQQGSLLYVRGTTYFGDNSIIAQPYNGGVETRGLLSLINADGPTVDTAQTLAFKMNNSAYSQITTGAVGSVIKNVTAGAEVGDLYFATVNAGTYSEKMRILGNGNVGIGTAAPSYKLDVAGFVNTDQYSGYKQAGNTILVSTTTKLNLAVGYNAMPSISSTLTGTSNTAIGTFALQYATSTNVLNTAVGYQALRGNSSHFTGTYNTALGSLSLVSVTTGGSNTAVGASALDSLTTGSHNTALGDNSAGNLLSGSYNLAFGYQALNNATSSSNNIAIGYQSLLGALATNTSGEDNVAIGSRALYNNGAGGTNVAIGNNAVLKNTSGSNNVGIGNGALSKSVTGNFSVGLGSNALANNLSATNTVAVGYQAGTGAASYSNQGGTYVGYRSGYKVGNASDYNTLLGYQSGYNVTTGQYNIQLGYQGTTGGLTTGSNNIVIGKDLRPTGFDGTASNQLNIGNLLFATGLGSGTTLGTGNVGVGSTTPWRTLSIGGTAAISAPTISTTGDYLCWNTTTKEIQAGTSCTLSSQAFKTNIVSLGDNGGLQDVLALRPVSFNFIQGYGDNGATTQLGFIAEEAAQVDPRLVTVDAKGNPNGFVYANYVSVLTKAIQEIEGVVNTTAYLSTSTPAMTITAVGNVGIGTTTPNHTLTVAGDVGAIAFVNTSTRDAKTNISYLDASSTDKVLTKLLQLKVATYRYKIENQNDPLRLGFIAEEAQKVAPEVLSPDGKGVDLYKLATFTLSGVQALALKVNGQGIKIDDLETRLAALERATSTSTGGATTAFSSSTLASALSSFGTFIQKGIAQFGSVVANQFVAATDSSGASSAGSGSILAGNTVTEVSNTYVTPTTKVFITFNAQVDGSWWVTQKTNGSFRVMLSKAQTTDVNFDYFLVQTKGQIATSTPQITTSSPATPDVVAPVVTLKGGNPIHVSVGATFTDPGVTVTDAVDGTDPYVTFINGYEQPVSSTTIVTSTPTTYIITYRATDKAGNNASITRSVIVGNPDGTVTIPPATTTLPVATTTPSVTTPSTASSTPADTTSPVVALKGSALMTLTIGDTFTDPGATATDAVDGDLTASIVKIGSVDTSTANTYTLKYSATDAAGNEGNTLRLVKVAAPAPAATPPATSTPPVTSTTTPVT